MKTLRGFADDSDAERNVSFDAENAILDATVYGLCEPHGGSTGVNREWQGDYPCRTCVVEGCEIKNRESHSLCGGYERPDCTGTVSVVTKEVWEAFVCEYAGEFATTKSAMRARWERETMKGTPESEEDGFDAHWQRLEEACTELLSTVLGKTRVARQILFVESTSAPYAAAGDTIAILEDDDG